MVFDFVGSRVAWRLLGPLDGSENESNERESRKGMGRGCDFF